MYGGVCDRCFLAKPARSSGISDDFFKAGSKPDWLKIWAEWARSRSSEFTKCFRFDALACCLLALDSYKEYIYWKIYSELFFIYHCQKRFWLFQVLILRSRTVCAKIADFLMDDDSFNELMSQANFYDNILTFEGENNNKKIVFDLGFGVVG